MQEQWGAELEVVIRVLQIALAPAFLLAAIASLLSVLTGRLARAVDRSHAVQAMLPVQSASQTKSLRDELAVLIRRKRLIQWSMQLCVAGGVTICAVVALLFVMGLAQFSAASLIVGMFALAMGLIAASLVALLIETSLAAHEVMVDLSDGEGSGGVDAS
ncbi:MAG: DUF2721 domain-containing protein [Brevundimonas sp.]|nr:DUF2721 domain-containing protein [Brevundimonas sp.]MCZ8321974.1 DUF2721 domain-containing protein [Novosphingobium sp.]